MAKGFSEAGPMRIGFHGFLGHGMPVWLCTKQGGAAEVIQGACHGQGWREAYLSAMRAAARDEGQ